MSFLDIFRINKKEHLLWESKGPDLTVQVWDKVNSRELRFGNKVIQSVFSKIKPRYLVLPYTRCMLLSLIFCPRPDSILHIGLGGGSIARWLHYEFSSVKQSIIEKNEDVVEAAYRFFEFPSDSRLQIFNADASKLLPKMSEKYDLIFLDAFNDFGAPKEVKQIDFLRSLYCRLKSSGLAVGNFWTLTGDFKEQCESWGSIFSTVYNLDANKKGNEILFGFKNYKIEEEIRYENISKILEKRHQIEFQKMKMRLIKLY